MLTVPSITVVCDACQRSQVFSAASVVVIPRLIDEGWQLDLKAKDGPWPAKCPECAEK
jgi:hypothetical protein